MCRQGADVSCAYSAAAADRFPPKRKLNLFHNTFAAEEEAEPLNKF